MTEEERVIFQALEKQIREEHQKITTDAINDYLKRLNQSSPTFKFEDEIGKAICNDYVSGEIQEVLTFENTPWAKEVLKEITQLVKEVEEIKSLLKDLVNK